jgi:hypothetical protein
MISGNIKLAWALVDGRLAHISEFRDVPRGQRPTAVCEACGTELVMKLGNIRAHHYAHRPRSHCPLTNPETAHHYNTKQHLASKLRATDSLSVVIKCAFAARRNPCSRDLTYVAAEGWDTVHVEKFIDPVRPDIVLLSKGAPTFAIEVRATHPVSEAKAASLFGLGISWIEVVAGAPSDEWEPESALRAERHSKDAPSFCSVHSDIVNANTQAGDSVVPRQPIAKTSSRTTPAFFRHRWRFRVVDCYPARGPRVRTVFWVYCSRQAPDVYHLRLVEDDTTRVISSMRNVRDPETALSALNQGLVRHLRRSYERFHSGLPWLDSSVFPDNPVTVYDVDFMPVKYQPDTAGRWVKVLRDVDDLPRVED